MTPAFKLHRWIAAISLLILMVGCGTPKIKVSLSSTANLNLNAVNEPLPVLVRIYQLSDPKPFEYSSFEDLWKDDLATLGDTLLTKDELVINPAAQKRVQYDRHPQARYFGALAIFRQPHDNLWRDYTKVYTGFVSKRFSETIQVFLRGDTIAIQE